MTRTLYIVDGYNVLHALFPRLARDELADRRRWLTDQLAGFAALRASEVVLVFDGRGRQATCTTPVEGAALEVCYSGGAFTADTLIARRIAEREADTSVVVVSADQEVQRTATRAGVSRMTPRELGLDITTFSQELDKSVGMSRMRSTLEDKVDVETLRKLEKMRTEPE
jgi:predicted RNA-binding protein with PIN domain